MVWPYPLNDGFWVYLQQFERAALASLSPYILCPKSPIWTQFVREGGSTLPQLAQFEVFVSIVFLPLQVRSGSSSHQLASTPWFIYLAFAFFFCLRHDIFPLPYLVFISSEDACPRSFYYSWFTLSKSLDSRFPQQPSQSSSLCTCLRSPRSLFPQSPFFHNPP